MSARIKIYSDIIIMNCNPAHPQFASANARLATFKEWPTDKRPTPSALVAAGFFYVCDGDKTKCWCCGGGLHEWLPQDEPKKEHDRNFSGCYLAQLNVKTDLFK